MPTSPLAMKELKKMQSPTDTMAVSLSTSNMKGVYSMSMVMSQVRSFNASIIVAI